MGRLFADEDFDHPVVEELRRLGHDVLTVQDSGRANHGFPDVDVLAFAVSEGRAVLTFNRRDFIRLHRQSSTHAGIIVCTRDVDVIALATRINRALGAQVKLDGQLIRIYRPS
jgi:predicted nuclease of predicted toxin-antitoxin system